MTKKEAVDKYMSTPMSNWPLRMQNIFGQESSFCGEDFVYAIEKWYDETFKTEE